MPCPSPRDLPNPEIKPRSLALQVDSLLSEPPGKPKNTGVGSLSLSLGDCPNTGIELGSPALQADSLPAELPGKPFLILEEKLTDHVSFSPTEYDSSCKFVIYGLYCVEACSLCPISREFLL